MEGFIVLIVLLAITLLIAFKTIKVVKQLNT